MARGSDARGRLGRWRAMTGLVSGLALAVSLMIGGAPAQAEDLLLNTGTVAPFNTPAGDGFVDRVVREAFARAGRNARVVSYPTATARALKLADSGQDDGVALRVAGLEARFPNLVRIPEKVMDNDFVALSPEPLPGRVDWSSLDGLAVGYILGWVIFEKSMPEGAFPTAVRDVPQLFGLLANRRADTILYERWQGLAAAQDRGLDVAVNEPPLASVEMFMYLHRDHADLVEPVADALRSMKADGTYDRILAETLLPLVPAVAETSPARQ